MCNQDLRTQTLAVLAGLGSVTLCPCGTVSLHVGGVSVRLETAAFVQTAEMCREAIEALKLHAQTLQSAATSAQSRMTH
ncbi:MAG: hypothetical protein WDN23_07425 [Edaphobacter sp.]